MIRAIFKFSDGSRKIDTVEEARVKVVSERIIIEYEPETYGNLVLYRSPVLREKVIFKLQHVVCDEPDVTAYYLEECH